MVAITLLCLLTLLALGGPPRIAAQETIASDRPGIGSGAFVLGPGTIQLETGVDYSSSASARAYSFGQALVRVGAPGFEVEIFANSYVVTRSDLPSGALDDEGFQDVGVGFKLPIARDVGGRLNLSLQGVLTAPSGSEAFTGDEWIPAFNALADVALGDRSGLSVNFGYQTGPGTLEGVTTVIVTPGISLEGGVGLYAGWAGLFAGGSATHVAEAGLSYLASADVQLDVNGGWDVERENWFLGAGVAVRWGAG